jgi:hypothetical protein
MTCGWLINPITNTNPVFSHWYTWQYIQIDIQTHTYNIITSNNSFIVHRFWTRFKQIFVWVQGYLYPVPLARYQAKLHCFFELIFFTSTKVVEQINTNPAIINWVPFWQNIHVILCFNVQMWPALSNALQDWESLILQDRLLLYFVSWYHINGSLEWNSVYGRLIHTDLGSTTFAGVKKSNYI